ncbi:MAG: DUF3298/DUF4163 domain-containing protein [Acidobacteria bacterium]|nr:MAG: DUF3298/DUF4163 domain-containing protein [Acidobacteriota bacterium]
MNRTTSIALLFLSALLSASLLAQDDNKVSDARFRTETIKESSDSKRFDIDVSYPALNDRSAMAGAFNKAAKEHAMASVTEFRTMIDEMTDEDRKVLPDGVNYTLDLGYEIEHADESLISVSFGISTYSGGAHPNHWTSTLNFDRKEMKELRLGDLFKSNSGYLNKISEIAIEDLTKQMGNFADEDWISRGAGPDEANFESWAISKKGLLFFFDPYEVGPYAAGGFEVVIPFEKFPLEMQSSKFYTAKTASYVQGNPPNWCRNGHFPSQDVEFSLVRVNGDRSSRAYFFGDDDDCPNGEECRMKAYVIGGDELLVARSYGDFVCAWYQPEKGNETVGWIKLEDVRAATGPEETASWTGEWIFGENDLKIENIGVGALSIKGNAFWKGTGDNIHIGEVDDQGTPNGRVMSIGGTDEYDCRVKMTRVGKYLIVSDNKNCGGVNVSFDGVYVRR